MSGDFELITDMDYVEVKVFDVKYKANLKPRKKIDDSVIEEETTSRSYINRTEDRQTELVIDSKNG